MPLNKFPSNIAKSTGMTDINHRDLGISLCLFHSFQCHLYTQKHAQMRKLSPCVPGHSEIHNKITYAFTVSLLTLFFFLLCLCFFILFTFSVISKPMRMCPQMLCFHHTDLIRSLLKKNTDFRKHLG